MIKQIILKQKQILEHVPAFHVHRTYYIVYPNSLTIDYT